MHIRSGRGDLFVWFSGVWCSLRRSAIGTLNCSPIHCHGSFPFAVYSPPFPLPLSLSCPLLFLPFAFGVAWYGPHPEARSSPTAPYPGVRRGGIYWVIRRSPASRLPRAHHSLSLSRDDLRRTNGDRDSGINSPSLTIIHPNLMSTQLTARLGYKQFFFFSFFLTSPCLSLPLSFVPSNRSIFVFL